MAVTLNGIAQGFAADRVRAALQARGVRHALVNTGEFGSLGRKSDGTPWTVGIQHPRRPDAYLALAALEERFLSTSGDYATSFSDDFRHNHIFDPRTGLSPTEFSSVTVLARTGMEADALTKVLFVGGLGRGLDLVRAVPGADALCVLKDGRTMLTDGFPRIA
jgi:thiamine biosynthesis lipoprotein